MVAVLMVALAASLGSAANAEGISQHCQQVHGRYAIYANRDALWIVGSKHLVEVSIDPLDKELQARGWENTVADGDFTVCSQRRINAHALTSRDAVRVIRYGNVRYVQH